MKYPGQPLPRHRPPTTFRPCLLGHQYTNICDMVHQTSFFPYSYFQARKYFAREVQLRSKFRVTRGCHREPLIGGLYSKTQ